MSEQMSDECAAALKQEFGYVPDAERGEKWVVYQDRVLIVVHPDNRPRLYRRGASGAEDYHEIEPLWP